MGGGCCVMDCGLLPCFFDSGCGDCSVGSSSENRDSDKHAKVVANELAEMKERQRESSEKLENSIVDHINASLNSFLSMIDELNHKDFGGESLKIDTTSIRKKNEKLKSRVVGCVGNVMDSRLVQTDKELGPILEERDEKKRKKNFEKFVERVQKEALKKLKEEIQSTIEEQTEVVENELNIRKREVNNRLNESIKEMSEIMDVKRKNDVELQNKQLVLMYQSSLCDVLLKEIQS